jgi:PAS domain S-box-containing protein
MTERAAAHVFELSNDLLGSASLNNYFTALNPAWERTLGFSREALMRQPFMEFVHPGDQAATLAEIDRMTADGVGTVQFENRYATHDGGWRWLSWQAEACPEGYYFIAHDVTAQIAAEQRRYLGASIVEGVDDAIMTETTDGVVTSWNRASEELYGFTASEAIGRSMVDLVVPAELGDEPERIIERLLAGEGVRQYTTRRHRKDEALMTVSLTASLLRDADHAVVGVAVISRDISEMDLDQDRARSELDALAWVGRIRDAIDDQRIVFYAQPIIRLDGEVESYELLCRMVDPEGAIVPPGRFLPAAESYGLIAELDLLAIEEGARQIAKGHRVNINLSTASVGRRHIVDVIADRLHAAGADPLKMTIEITETALMKDLVAAQRFAVGASKLGCRISLDDFGTGFGGFTYLKRLPIHQLKIDVEFVRDLSSCRESQHVVKAVASLARGLNLESVAEGVEDDQTFALLQDYGVTHAQGYLIAPPAPVADAINQPTSFRPKVEPDQS